MRDVFSESATKKVNLIGITIKILTTSLTTGRVLPVGAPPTGRDLRLALAPAKSVVSRPSADPAPAASPTKAALASSRINIRTTGKKLMLLY